MRDVKQRLLRDAVARKSEFLDAARVYPTRIPTWNLEWLYMKPFEWTSGPSSYHYNISKALGLLKFMNVSLDDRILEVGCGPGWVTELLLMLGCRVTATDPSPGLLRIARDRVEQASSHYRKPEIRDRVQFVEGAIEDLTFSEESFDGVIFYDVLHHVVEEVLALSNCAKWLRPGGTLGIVEGAWLPGSVEQEKPLFEEMSTFGTLENPFTQEYLNQVLRDSGFTTIQRLVCVSGMFPAESQTQSLLQHAVDDPSIRNDLVARKPYDDRYSCNSGSHIAVDVHVESIERIGNTLRISASVENLGDTILIGGAYLSGSVMLALRQGSPLSGKMVEGGRALLPKDLARGQRSRISMDAPLPDFPDGWELDVVVEHVAWLSTRGFSPIPISW